MSAVTIRERFSILLVDDDPTVIVALSRILNGYEPLRFATSGKDALRLATESPPDLILLDVGLSDMSGFEVCKRFKESRSLCDVPVIFISSHETVQMQSAGLDLGAVDFITKPPHAPLVLARVRQHRRMKELSDTVRGAVSMDFLTGAATRLAFEKSLGQECRRAQRSAQPLSLLLTSLDDVSRLNSKYDDSTRDGCIKEVAHALRTAVHRPEDLIARFSESKFAVLLPRTDSEGAYVVAQRAIAAVDSVRISGSDTERAEVVSISVGCGCFAPNVGGTDQLSARGTASEEMLAAAEQALGVASRIGHRAMFVDVAYLGAPDAAMHRL